MRSCRERASSRASARRPLGPGDEALARMTWRRRPEAHEQGSPEFSRAAVGHFDGLPLRDDGAERQPPPSAFASVDDWS